MGRLRRWFLLVYAASGAAALLYEVAWTRLLALQLGHTVAAASTVLAAFMGGLAAGAMMAGRWLAAAAERRHDHTHRADPNPAGGDTADDKHELRRRRVEPLRAYALLEIAAAVCAVALPFALAACAPLLRWAYADGTAPAQFAVIRVAIALAIVGVPAAAMGATFPIATSWFSVSAAETGALYAANTAGAAIGAVAAGFFLIPTLGVRATTGIGVALNVVAAAGAWAIARATASTQTAGAAEPAHAGATGNGAARRQIVATSGRTTSSGRSGAADRRRSADPARGGEPWLASAAAAVSGGTALIYEVAWTRLLALVLGPTTYAFATMAAAFVSGLAAGSAIGAAIARRTARPILWLGALLIASSVSASATAYIAATRVPLAVAARVADPDIAFAPLIFSEAAATMLLLLPVTLALGATFSLALAVADAGGRATGRDAARVYTANTIGAIAGALGGGFLLVPSLGLRATIAASSLAGAIAGAACIARGVARGRQAAARPAVASRRSPSHGQAAHRRNASVSARKAPAARGDARLDEGPSAAPFDQPSIGAVGSGASAAPARSGVAARWSTRGVVVGAAVAAASVAAVLLLPPWDRELLASGAYKYAPYLASNDFDAMLRAGRLEYYREGAASTVSVRRLAGTTSLAIDGKIDASNAGDMLTQRLLGLLPVLMHGRAREIAIIGLGSGVTAGSALAVPSVERAEVVEISPEVVAASRFFDRESGAPLANPRVRLIVGDGRSHLLLTTRRYDVIVSEPSNPWMAGVATLFTREFFEAARARLNPDGLLCQWAHTYDISPADLKSIVATFSSVFPQATMWLVGDGDLLLIGAAGGTMDGRLANLATGATDASVAAPLASVGISPGQAAFDLLSLFTGGPAELSRYANGAPLQTDDRTSLEYSAPHAIYGKTTTDNAAAIRAVAGIQPEAVRAAIERASDADWASRGHMQLRAEAYRPAYEAFARALSLNPANSDALEGLLDSASGAGRNTDARKLLESIVADGTLNVPARVALSRLIASTGDFDGAAAVAAAAFRMAPSDPRAGEQLASVVADAGDAERLTPLAASLAAQFPDRPDPRYYAATALFLRGKTEDALEAARHVTDRYPGHARAQNLVGAACATLGRRDCARAAFAASLRANPHDASTYVNLARFCLQSGSPEEAANYFAEALTIDPSSGAAREGLAQSRAALANNPR